jgi:hypothetical protein
LKEGNYSLTRNIGGSSSIPGGKGRGRKASQICNKFADEFITPMGQLPSQNGMFY